MRIIVRDGMGKYGWDCRPAPAPPAMSATAVQINALQYHDEQGSSDVPDMHSEPASAGTVLDTILDQLAAFGVKCFRFII